MKQIDSNFKWSFSKLSSFQTCPLEFCLQYLQDPPLPQEQNPWAEFGILCHALLEEYAKGEIEKDMLAFEYASRYDNIIQHHFPPYPKGYAENTYQQGLAYFENFEGFGSQYQVLSAEEKFEIPIRGYRFVGVSDLTLRNMETGKITVIDHKTKSESSMKSEVSLYRHQLYLYAEYVKQHYGEFPETIQFNMIKSEKPIIEQFSPERHEETLNWLENTITDILFETQWNPNPKQYYCKFICSMLPYCEAGMDISQYCPRKNK